MSEYNHNEVLENLYTGFKKNLIKELNSDEPLTEEELKQTLKMFIEEYEEEFQENYSDIFLYTYYQNLLNNNTMDAILNFVKTRKGLDSTGKQEILKKERKDCYNVLYLYNINCQEQEKGKYFFKSMITGREIPIIYQVGELISNTNIFMRPPKGNPALRGPHVNYTIEYSPEYWENFKQDILNYINNFEKTHSQDFLEDLEDFRYWLNKYRILTTFLDQEKEIGGKHVKN